MWATRRYATRKGSLKRLFAKTVRTESVELSQVLVKVESNHSSIKEEIYFSDWKNSSQKKEDIYVDSGYIRFYNNSNNLKFYNNSSNRRFREKANTRNGNIRCRGGGNSYNRNNAPQTNPEIMKEKF